MAFIGVALLLVATTGLFWYKWSGSIRVLGDVNTTGVLNKSPDPILTGGAFTATLRYLRLVWPALTFGIVIGTIVQTLPSGWIDRVLARNRGRSIVAGGLVGAPLMLCACCASPVGAGLYARGARLGSSLALMMSSPGLNVAALVLTFMILPTEVAVARLAGALAIVFGVSFVVDRIFDDIRVPPPPTNDRPPRTASEIVSTLGRSLATMTIVTVPLIFLGVLASSWLIPYATSLSDLGTVLAIVAIAAIATLVALPTFFEIPLALLLVAAGAPTGAIVAFVIAGPIVNLPSLVILARQTNVRIAAGVAAGVWLIATAAGLAVSL